MTRIRFSNKHYDRLTTRWTRYGILWFVCIFCLVVALAVNAQSLEHRVIQGTVLNEDTGRPIANAEIKLEIIVGEDKEGADMEGIGIPVHTDSKGHFRIARLMSMSLKYDLVITAPGYSEGFYEIKPPELEKEPVVVEIDLTRTAFMTDLHVHTAATSTEPGIVAGLIHELYQFPASCLPST